MREMNVDNLIIEKIFGCSREEFPIRYLEMPLRDIQLRKEDWIGII